MMRNFGSAMEFRNLKAFVFFVAMLLSGSKTYAQSEPTTAKPPQLQLPEIQAVPPRTEANRALPEVSAVANVPATLGRPILFVHGCGGEAEDWRSTFNLLAANLSSLHSNLYPSNSTYVVV